MIRRVFSEFVRPCAFILLVAPEYRVGLLRCDISLLQAE